LRQVGIGELRRAPSGFGERQQLRSHRDGGERVAVDHRFDLLERLVADGARVREIEPQPLGIDQRTLLLHMVA
jgi:hypothetical protein